LLLRERLCRTNVTLGGRSARGWTEWRCSQGPAGCLCLRLPKTSSAPSTLEDALRNGRIGPGLGFASPWIKVPNRSSEAIWESWAGVYAQRERPCRTFPQRHTVYVARR
jgi:hypothetical protein